MKSIVPIFLAFLFFSVALSPAFALEQKMEIKQAPIPGASLPYTSNLTDFRQALPWDVMREGIYLGPHLPVFQFSFNKVTADVLLYFNFTLNPQTYLYGAGEYYILIPVLNSPNEVRLGIWIDGTRWIGLEPYSADDLNFEDALKYGVLQYSEDYGYLVHVFLIPLLSNITHHVLVRVQFQGDASLRTLITQEIPEGLNATDVQFGKYYTYKMASLYTYHSANAVPLAFALVAVSGITSSGLYSVTLPPTVTLYLTATTASAGYPTLNLFINPAYTSLFEIRWKWYDEVTTSWETCTHNVTASHFLVDSANGKSKAGSTAFVWVKNIENVSSKIFLFVSNSSSSTPAAYFVFGDMTSTVRYPLNDFGFAHIAGNISFESTQFIGLNSTYQASDNFVAKKALAAATYLYLEDLEHQLPVLSFFLHRYTSAGDFADQVRRHASNTSSPLLMFKDLLHGAWNFLSSIGRILYGYLLKFWNWLVSGFTWLWDQLQPVLQLITYTISIWFVMFLTTKMGHFLQNRKEVAQ